MVEKDQPDHERAEARSASRRSRVARPDLCGVMVIDKPEGPSSMRAVETVRRRAGGVKTGHAGTLDPLATGILILALGKATKWIDRLMATDKRYVTMIDLSAFTTTDDREGERREVQVEHPPTRAMVDAVLPRFTGTIMQRPPAFSAVKIDGRRAYKLARSGQAAEIPAREVIVHSIDVTRYEWPELEIAIHCEKGVYVRSLARDIGAALGTGGHCLALRRTAVGPFDESMAIALEQVPEPVHQSDLIALGRVEAMLSGS